MDFSYITSLAEQLGISTWLFAVIFVWSLTWKLIALWKSVKNDHVAWFIVLALFNTIGILPILYIYVFSHLGNMMEKASKKKKPKKKK